MTIEALIVRDPDSAADLRIWVDGVEVTADVSLVQVDPGAGWTYDDWVESAAAAAAGATSEAARTAIAVAYADPPGTKYIDGWPDD